MNYLIYDLEIIKAIPPKVGEPRIEGIEYCQGWKDFQNMGISVIGAYDYKEDRYRVFCKDNFDEFMTLINSREPVGFNNISFDDQLLFANGFELDISPLDLLRETWVAAGLAPEWQGWETHGGYGLDAICYATFGNRKTGQGALAPVDWQQGKIGKVIDYCLNDIKLTKQLLDCALEGKPIINPRTGKIIYYEVA